MRIKTIPEDFHVEELLKITLRERGPYAIFRVKKRNTTTMEAQVRLAAALSLPLSAVRFPALKDKVAVAIQHCSIRVSKKAFPDQIVAPRVSAILVGFSDRHLAPQDLAGNRFIVTLRDLREEEAKKVRVRLEMIGKNGFPNYFDLQRFGSWSPGLGFPGKLLLLRRWEEALRAYLAEPLSGDPPQVLRFKKEARAHWGEWKLLKERAPRGNLRSVLTFLCDHPQEHKRAVNLITPRVLSLWLSAYQSFLWNRAASRVIQALAGGGQPLAALPTPFGELAIPRYPLDAAFRAKVRELSVPLPSAKTLSKPPSSARTAPPSASPGGVIPSSPVLPKEEGPDPASSSTGAFLSPSPPRGEGWGEGELVLQALFAVLAEEGLAPGDLKARGLERAYLGGGKRALWVFPAEPKLEEPELDELFPGQKKLTLSFTLSPGGYATVVLRLLHSEFATVGVRF